MVALRSVLVFVALLALAAPTHAQTKIVLVGVDQRTERELGPFGGGYRAHHATLIKRLNQARAQGIAFDVYFPPNPDQTAATRQLAAAAATSVSRGVPVVIAVGSEPDALGEHRLIPNDRVFQGKGIGEGAVATRRELTGLRFNGTTTVPTHDGERPRTGAEVLAEFDRASGGTEVEFVEPVSGGLILPRRSDGYRPLVEELALRTGLLADEDHLERLGLVEDVSTGFDQDGPVLEPMLRPDLAHAPPAEVTVVSYVDVLNKRVDPKLLEGALVLVGMNDGQLDMHETPDPRGSPDLEAMPGVFVHVALLQRVARAVASEARPQTPAKGGTTRGLVVVESQ